MIKTMEQAVDVVLNDLTEGFDPSAPIGKRVLVSKLHKDMASKTRGFFSDSGWQNVNKAFKVFDDLKLDWNTTEVFYGNHKHDRTMPPERKRWNFEIRFTNRRGNRDTIYGVLTAAGAGKASDPLERYDITVTMG